jgi:hypothetical protein
MHPCACRIKGHSFDRYLGARIRGSELGATDLWLRARRQDLWLRGTGHVSATSDALLCAVRHLGAKICGAEMCYLGAMSSGADPRVKDEFTSPRGLNVNVFQKRLNIKKIRYNIPFILKYSLLKVLCLVLVISDNA